MRRDPFISLLIEKLNNLKRDREVREKLADSLREFSEYSAKVLAKKKPSKANSKTGITTTEVRTVHWGDQKFENNRQINRKIVSQKKSLETKRPRAKRNSNETQKDDVTIIGYCFAGNPVPYRTKVRGMYITLAHFKTLFNRKGNFRYFFKKYSNEFGTKIVFEEVADDEDILPLWDGKIFAMVEEIEEYKI
ncbi:Axin-1, partial [Stegodyphus mimosarum]